MIRFNRLFLSVKYKLIGRTLLVVSCKFRVRDYLCLQEQGLFQPCVLQPVRDEKAVFAFHRQL